MGEQLMPCLNGLILCILPGFEEQDDNLHKILFQFLKQLLYIVGDVYFYSNLWKILLNSNKNRLQVLKVLDKFLNQQDSIAKIECIEAAMEQKENWEFLAIIQEIKNQNDPLHDINLILNAFIESL